MLGLHPMAALTGIHIIEGKPSLSANLLGALVRRAGHRLRVTTTGNWEDGTFVARAALMRSDDPDFEFVVEWTPARAKQAGLAGRGNWSKYPEAMSKARAITEVIREGAPDVTMAAAYTPEELGAQVEGEEGDPIELVQAPKQQAPIQDAPAQPMSSPADEPEPAPKPRATRKPKAKPEATPEAATAMADAEAKARVKANQEARVAAEAKADAPVEADPETGEVIDEGHSYDDVPHEDVVVPQEDRSAYARAESAATNPDNIEDAQLVDDAEQTDFASLLAEAEDLETVRGLYREASSKGQLGLEIQWNGEARALGAVITEVGKAFADLATQPEA